MIYAFVVALLVSSSLLMVVQPMVGKMVLPHLGGVPAIWNTCVCFFQTVLLVGYAYAHLGPRWLGVRWHAALHLVAIATASVLLPFAIPAPDSAPEYPALWLFATLLSSLGVPLILVCASAPLFQRWFAQSGSANPYVLYSASNLGSFVGLWAYPLILESRFDLAEQGQLWRVGYFVLCLATLLCAVTLISSRRVVQNPSAAASTPTWRQVGRWILLALVPSSLLLSVTHHVTTDIAGVPLLWIVPLSIYLLTFVLAFAPRTWLPRAVVLRWTPMVVMVVLFVYLSEATDPLGLILGIHLFGLFWIGMLCHGELAHTRPDPQFLTSFYFWLALGGVLGGALNTFVAPSIFTGLAEYPLVLVLALLLRPGDVKRPRWLDAAIPVGLGAFSLGLIWLQRRLDIPAGPMSAALLFALPMAGAMLFRSPLRQGLGVGAVMLASWFYAGVQGEPLWRARSFFGIHRVTEKDGLRKLVHGNTQHGMQWTTGVRKNRPLTYYYRTGPVGTVLMSLRNDPRLQRVGLVGLGAGALAAYAQKGEHWTFFEIDPAVVHIARDGGWFTYLDDARARGADINVVVGDARMSLRHSDERFGVLIIDAFGSDSIPIHLLTREAFALYRKHLQPGGILLFHVSHRYLRFEPVLAKLAEDQSWSCLIREDLTSEEFERRDGKFPSIWCALTENRRDLPKLDGWRTAQIDATPLWRDDFAYLAGIFDFQVERGAIGP